MSTLTQSFVLTAKQLRRALGLSPMQMVLRRLQRLGFKPETFEALEAFGGTGVNHTPDIYRVVAHLDFWDIAPARRADLARKFPRAEVFTVDSYLAIRTIAKTYDLVVLDAGEQMGERYEHFEMFPYVFRALKPRAVLILNETPRISDTDPERLRQRREFYGAPDPSNIGLDQVQATYRKLAEENGFRLDNIFFKWRWALPGRGDPMYYCVMTFQRMNR